MTTYTPDSTLAALATVARMRGLTGDVYAAQGRALLRDSEMLDFIFDLDTDWKALAQKANGFRNSVDIPDPITDTDDRVEGTNTDYEEWSILCRRAAAEACLALSMRNPEWSPGRHTAYRTRALELLPASIDLKRY